MEKCPNNFGVSCSHDMGGIMRFGIDPHVRLSNGKFLGEAWFGVFTSIVNEEEKNLKLTGKGRNEYVLDNGKLVKASEGFVREFVKLVRESGVALRTDEVEALMDDVVFRYKKACDDFERVFSSSEKPLGIS